MSYALNKEMTVSGVTYNSLHWWIRRNYGKANKCEHDQCSRQSNTFEWSLIKGKSYEKNIDNFRQLCRKCHFNFDVSPKHRNSFENGRFLAQKKRIGMKHSEESKRKMSNSLKGRKVWNKGKKWSAEAKLKMSISHKGKVPWNKGLKTT